MLFLCKEITKNIFQIPFDLNIEKIGAITINGYSYNPKEISIIDNKIYLDVDFPINQLILFENRNFDSLYILNKQMKKEVVTNVYKTSIPF